MEITISKNIDDLRIKMSDDKIIKSLFDKVVLTNPRRCMINSKNEILIKNYGISKKQDNWTKSNPIMTGFNRWQLISDAKFKIDNLTNSIIYKIDITRIIILNTLFPLLFSLFICIGFSKGSGNVWHGIKSGFIGFIVFLSFFSLGILIQYVRHKNFIDDFIKIALNNNQTE